MSPVNLLGILFKVLGWFHAIEAYQKSDIDLPINLKFCFEGMEESGSEGLDQLLVNPLLFLGGGNTNFLENF